MTSQGETARPRARHLNWKVRDDDRLSNRRRPSHEKEVDDAHIGIRNLSRSLPSDLPVHSYSHCRVTASPRHCTQTKDDFLSLPWNSRSDSCNGRWPPTPSSTTTATNQNEVPYWIRCDGQSSKQRLHMTMNLIGDGGIGHDSENLLLC